MNIISNFKEGLHSNIPLCCVIQWIIEEWIVKDVVCGLLGIDSVGDLPWRKIYLNTVVKEQYWPCVIHQWLIDHKCVKPRVLNICDPDDPVLDFGGLCRPCPHCLKNKTTNLPADQ